MQVKCCATEPNLHGKQQKYFRYTHTHISIRSKSGNNYCAAEYCIYVANML